MRIEVTRQIDAAPERVFEVFTDLAQATERIEAIEHLEVLTDGPIGEGTRFTETRKIFGKSSSETMTITSFDPPASYTVEAESCGTHYISSYSFDPVDKGTRVAISFEGRPITLLAKLMMPLGILMCGSIKKMIAKDMDDLSNCC